MFGKRASTMDYPYKKDDIVEAMVVPQLPLNKKKD